MPASAEQLIQTILNLQGNGASPSKSALPKMGMKYVSTRGESPVLGFSACVLEGLAQDGGLYVPAEMPKVSIDELKRWSTLSFVDLALEVMSLFIPTDEIPKADLHQILRKSFSTFRDPNVTPVVATRNTAQTGRYILELFHGPTYAFKDVALQFLGNLFEYLLTRLDRRLTVLGATSGDTGAAAIHGLKGKNNVDVFILFPQGRVSPTQEKLMTTILDENVHNVAIEGTFDDAQAIVKELMTDLEFKQKHSIGAINSINFARILAQTVYYFSAYFQVARAEGFAVGEKKVHFSVPTGNFGDILAGFYAKRIGLPVQTLIAATNSNSIVHRFFSRGEYVQTGVVPTKSPAMDIQVSSNFERYLYILCGEDASKLRDLMRKFHSTGQLIGTDEMLRIAVEDGWASGTTNDQATFEMMREMYATEAYVADPHTSVGISAAKQLDPGFILRPMVCLSCAHPGKFGETMEEALGEPYVLPPALAGLDELETRLVVVPATSAAIRNLLEETLGAY